MIQLPLEPATLGKSKLFKKRQQILLFGSGNHNLLSIGNYHTATLAFLILNDLIYIYQIRFMDSGKGIVGQGILKIFKRFTDQNFLFLQNTISV